MADQYSPMFMLNSQVIDFLLALYLHKMPRSLEYLTYFYLAGRLILFSVVATFTVILLKQRQFWLFRVVKVPKGRIICPNACEGLLTFASIFYVCDSAYRWCSLKWFYDESSPQTNFLLFTGLRLFPLWTAGFVHVVAIALLGRISTNRLNPIVWHLFLFGTPFLVLAVTGPSLYLANMYNNRANVIFQRMRLGLEASPSSRISIANLALLVELNDIQRSGFYHFRTWVITVAVFDAFLLGFTLCTGITLICKIYSAIQVQKRKCNDVSMETSDYIVVQEGQQTVDHEKDGPWTGTKGHTRASPSNSSTCFYEARERQQQPIEPTEKSKVAVLTDFLIHTSMQTFCLVAMGASMLGAVIYMTVRLLQDVSDTTNPTRFQQQLVATGFIFHVIEMSSVMIFGTPLVVLMLYRQCFPIKVEVKMAVQRQWNKAALDEPTASPSFPNNVVLPCPQEQHESSYMDLNDEQVGHAPLCETWQSPSQDITRDACGYTGPGAGRSIVLDALGGANQYPRRRSRAAPWQVLTNGGSITNARLEPRGQEFGMQLYPTPHGVVQGIPLSSLAEPGECSTKT